MASTGVELWRKGLEREHGESAPERLEQLGALSLVPGLSVDPRDDAVLFAAIHRLEADLWRVDAEEILEPVR